MLSQNMGRKRNSGRVLFLSFLIASLRTIFVVWLLLVWDRVLCQNQCTEVAEKWDFFFFSTAQLILGKKKSPNPFNIKLLKKFPSLASWETDTKRWQGEQKLSGFVQKE